MENISKCVVPHTYGEKFQWHSGRTALKRHLTCTVLINVDFLCVKIISFISFQNSILFKIYN